MKPVAPPVTYVCPRCRGDLESSDDGYRCVPCDEVFPVIGGIPDFRIAPDPWIGIAEDRAKARRLERETAGMGLEETVRAYWHMTPDTPHELAHLYIDHVLAAQRRSAEWLDEIDTSTRTVTAGPWLDLGCGTGDLIAAATERGSPTIVGIDVALRWLVAARKRPELGGEHQQLICACAEHLPFADGAFRRVLALGLLEHCLDPLPVCTEARRMLAAGGDVVLRTVNRYTVLREPHVRVWGVGFLPRRFASAYVRRVTGRSYEHHRPLSVRELQRALRGAGFGRVRAAAATVLPSERRRLGRLAQLATPAYHLLRQTPVARSALAWIAPLLEASGVAA